MRKWIMGLALAMAMVGAASAQDTEIKVVIGSQIEAFQTEKLNEAFDFASPMIQGIFRTPENFGRMVAQGYPMVWRPAEVTYLELSETNGMFVQKVQILDTEGRVHLLNYAMLETENGWKINGVQLLESTALSA